MTRGGGDAYTTWGGGMTTTPGTPNCTVTGTWPMREDTTTDGSTTT